MNVASKELCEELYKLSGWVPESTQESVWQRGSTTLYGHRVLLNEGDIPAYDLGYLLRKLPHKCTWDDETYTFGLWKGSAGYSTGYGNGDGEMVYYGEDEFELFFVADTPEDAVCELVIQLIKAGILTPDTTNKETE